jgi:pimeloyl-ACP methyl ester carboxylesterase
MTMVTVGIDREEPIELSYEDHGSGRPVVLVHGWPMSSESWEAQVLALVDAGHRVITYDRRGFGRSSRPWQGYDYDTLALDLSVLITNLDLSGVTLVGTSMGSGEVVRYLGRYGHDRISRVVLASTITPYLLRTRDNPEGGLDEETILAFEGAVRVDRLAFIEQFLIDFYSADGELKISAAQRRYLESGAALASPKGTLDCIAAFGRTDLRDDLAGIALPTLIIHGDSDAVVPFEAGGRRTQAAIAGSEVALIEGAPHGCNVSHPAQFNDALLGFLG